MSEDKKSDTAKKIGSLAKKATKATVKAGKFVKETINEMQEENQQKQPIIQNKTVIQDEKRNLRTNQKHTGIDSLDQQIAVWAGWFWSTIIYLFIITISFMISSTDDRFRLLPWVLVIGFPFFLFKAMISSIPEIKIGNRVIVSRKNISYRDQLTFTKTMFRTFSKEMWRNSPEASFVLLLFILLLAYALISPFL